MRLIDELQYARSRMAELGYGDYVRDISGMILMSQASGRELTGRARDAQRAFQESFERPGEPYRRNKR